MLILLLGLFIILQILLEKKGLPPKLAQVKLRYLLLASIGFIVGAMLLGLLLHIPVPLTAAATIAASVVISYRFRLRYDEFEKGKII